MGRSEGKETLPQRVMVLSGFKVCCVAARDTASCAVIAAGDLFTWGGGQDGRRGHGDKAAKLAPKCVAVLRGEGMVAVSVGDSHTIAVTRGGSVFGWGRAAALGLRPENADFPENGKDEICILSPCRYPELSCVPSP